MKMTLHSIQIQRAKTDRTIYFAFMTGTKINRKFLLIIPKNLYEVKDFMNHYRHRLKWIEKGHRQSIIHFVNKKPHGKK